MKTSRRVAHSTEQGDNMIAVANLENTRFGRLLVLKRAGSDKNNRAVWLCACDCGGTSILTGNALQRGTKSCGCLHREGLLARNITHGKTKTQVYRTWKGIKNRCLNKATRSYPRYGGRGITVHEDWLNNFDAFYAHIGDPPSPQHSIDRINNDGNYEPGNVRWATDVEQANNKDWPGYSETHTGTLVKAVRDAGAVVPYHAAKHRLQRGWDIERAISQPPRKIKLNAEKLEIIRALHADGVGNAEIARRFSVSRPTISRALAGATWAASRGVMHRVRT